MQLLNIKLISRSSQIPIKKAIKPFCYINFKTILSLVNLQNKSKIKSWGVRCWKFLKHIWVISSNQQACQSRQWTMGKVTTLLLVGGRLHKERRISPKFLHNLWFYLPWGSTLIVNSTSHMWWCHKRNKKCWSLGLH